VTGQGAGFTVRVENGREFRRALRAAEADMNDMKAAHARVAGYVAGVAATMAPRRTGRLAGSIQGNRAQATAKVYSRLPYSGPIHWGWPARNIPARQFLVTAAGTTRPTWQAMYEAELARIVRELDNSTPGASPP
jgi:hypothetical protein